MKISPKIIIDNIQENEFKFNFQQKNIQDTFM